MLNTCLLSFGSVWNLLDSIETFRVRLQPFGLSWGAPGVPRHPPGGGKLGSWRSGCHFEALGVNFGRILGSPGVDVWRIFVCCLLLFVVIVCVVLVHGLCGWFAASSQDVC